MLCQNTPLNFPKPLQQPRFSSPDPSPVPVVPSSPPGWPWVMPMLDFCPWSPQPPPANMYSPRKLRAEKVWIGRLILKGEKPNPQRVRTLHVSL